MTFLSSRSLLALLAAALAGTLVGLVLGLHVLRPEAPPQKPPPVVEPTAVAPATYVQMSFAALPGWGRDHLGQALPAIQASCGVFSRLDAEDMVGTGGLGRPAAAWQRACAGLADAKTDDELRERIERLFTPYAVTAPGKNGGRTPDGRFTGYYEADLNGSFERGGSFQVPIYGVPRDLVTVNISDFMKDVPVNVPRQLVGHVNAGERGNILKPYYTRAEIDRENVLAEKAEVLLWADDPVAVHILHIQGSGRVTLPDGRQVHVGFAGHNGHSFRGIGSILRDAGILKPGQASMDKVRTWLRGHPAEAAAYMDQNARYIFFRIRPADATGPLGSQGVALTAGRSLAVDPRFIPLGAPLWLETSDPDGVAIRRLMVAQDTGAAITGAVRGDLFWGHGESAFAMAARMSSPGRYFVLVPSS